MNGQKTTLQMKDNTDHEFDSWRTSSQSHYSHSSALQTNQSSDPYAMSYYPTAAMFPYSESMPSSQPWSNGAETVAFLGQYADAGAHQPSQGHYTMEAMFGSQTSYPFSNMASSMPSTPFNAFYNSDPFWGNNKARPQTNAPPAGAAYGRQMHDTSDYASQYSHHSAGDHYGLNDQTIKQMETGIAALTLDHIKASEQFANKSGAFGDSKKFSDSMSMSAVGSVPKKTTWASIASQPAKPQPKSLKSKMSSSVLTGSTSKHLPPVQTIASTAASMDAIGTWEAKNGSAVKTPPAAHSHSQHHQSHHQPPPPPSQRPERPAPASSQQPAHHHQPPPPPQQQSWARAQPPLPTPSARAGGDGGAGVGPPALPAHPVLDKLRVENNYNPKEFDLNPRNARFFIIKSYSEDDIHRSIKYSIWCSTEHGNKRLDTAFKQHEKTGGQIFLLFSVNGSGHFCGMAQMTSSVDYASSSSVWAQDKWKGQFRVRWVYVKDVPNAQLRHIRLENNENKPVTNSRDTQEVPFEKGKAVIKIMHHFRHTTSIFDDFLHYEKRQEEESQRRVPEVPSAQPPPPPKRQWKSREGASRDS